MAIQHHFTILCDYLMQDKSEKFGFIGTFVNIELDQIPGSLARFSVAVGFMGESEGLISIELIDPEGTIKANLDAGSGPVPTQIIRQYQQLLNVIAFQIQGLEFQIAGVHYILVKDGEEEKHRLPIGVLLKQPINVVAEEIEG